MSQSSDEPDTCPPLKCYADEVACPNQPKCIPRSVLCDGLVDCAGGWDEANCTAQTLTCLPQQFTCKHGPSCIPSNWVCDKDSDCDDGEGERNCDGINTKLNVSTETPLPAEMDVKECSTQEFNCYLGSDECVTSSSRCACLRLTILNSIVFKTGAIVNSTAHLARTKKGVMNPAAELCSSVRMSCALST